MILKGRLSKILVNINHNIYKKYIVLEKGVKVLYTNLQKYKYGLMRSELLFYLKLATDLKKMVSL